MVAVHGADSSVRLSTGVYRTARGVPRPGPRKVGAIRMALAWRCGVLRCVVLCCVVLCCVVSRSVELRMVA